MTTNSVICFHSPGEENDFLSNWFLSDFEYNGVKYTSMEQYMMHYKAMLFNDNEVANKILSVTDFAKIKALGRKVKNFDEGTWNEFKEQIVATGVMCKFEQNEQLKAQLLSTGDVLLVECAVRDKIWGIGLSMHDSRRFTPALWQGQNLLGKCLMTARDRLKNNNASN